MLSDYLSRSRLRNAREFFTLPAFERACIVLSGSGEGCVVSTRMAGNLRIRV